MSDPVPPMIVATNGVLVPSSAHALKTLGMSTSIAAGVAAAQVIAAALPGAAYIFLSGLPPVAQPFVGPLLTAFLLGGQVYLLSWAKQLHNTAVDRALSIPTSRISPARG